MLFIVGLNLNIFCLFYIKIGRSELSHHPAIKNFANYKHFTTNYLLLLNLIKSTDEILQFNEQHISFMLQSQI